MQKITMNQISVLTKDEKESRKIVNLLRYKIKNIKRKYHNKNNSNIKYSNGTEVKIPQSMSYSCSYVIGKDKQGNNCYVVYVHYYNSELTTDIKNIILETFDQDKENKKIFFKEQEINLDEMKSVYIHRSSPYYTGYLEKEDIVNKKKSEEVKHGKKVVKYKIEYKPDKEVLSANTFARTEIKNETEKKETQNNISKIDDGLVIAKINHYEVSKNGLKNAQKIKYEKKIQTPLFFIKPKNNIPTVFFNYGIFNIKLDFSDQISSTKKMEILLNGIGGKRGLGMGFLYPDKEKMQKFKEIDKTDLNKK